ncbi:MAG: hypothetical protein CMG46_04365 [Candidatus Marinimicrobia bacterium]|nr:hypothetical protein [Candidatus Neomarinimicrobiota bacterium]
MRQELEIVQVDRTEQPHIADTSGVGVCSRKTGVRPSAGSTFRQRTAQIEQNYGPGVDPFSG